jgi:hypothetical protein
VRLFSCTTSTGDLSLLYRRSSPGVEAALIAEVPGVGVVAVSPQGPGQPAAHQFYALLPQSQHLQLVFHDKHGRYSLFHSEDKYGLPSQASGIEVKAGKAARKLVFCAQSVTTRLEEFWHLPTLVPSLGTEELDLEAPAVQFPDVYTTPCCALSAQDAARLCGIQREDNESEGDWRRCLADGEDASSDPMGSPVGESGAR